MSYISHENFKKMMGKFQVEAPKSKLIKESWRSDPTDEEEEYVIYMQDKLLELWKNGKIDEKTYDAAIEALDRESSQFRADGFGAEELIKYVTDVKEGNAFTAGLAKTAKGGEFKVGDKAIKDTSSYDANGEKVKEGLKPDPLQATGPTVVTKEEQAPFGFSVLSPDERQQLKEYIDSIKTIKEEIAKLTAKAGKKVKEGDLGGDRTDLVMTKQTMSEISDESYERIEGLVNVKLHDIFGKAAKMIIKDLSDEGFDEGEILMYLKHEVEKKAKEAIDSQHDLP